MGRSGVRGKRGAEGGGGAGASGTVQALAQQDSQVRVQQFRSPRSFSGTRPSTACTTYTGASSRAWSWCPPPRGHRDPHTSSSRCCRGTGWAHSAHAHRTQERTALEEWVAVGPPPPLPRECVLAHAGTGFSPPLSEKQTTRKLSGASSVSAPWRGCRRPRSSLRTTRAACVSLGFVSSVFQNAKTSLLLNRFNCQQNYIYISFLLLGSSF